MANKEENVSFAWNKEKGIIESKEADIFVRPFGQSLGRGPSQYVLYMGKREIGFATLYPAQITKDKKRIWEVSEVCIEVHRGGTSTGTIYARRTKFVDTDEQSRAISLIKAALSEFYDISWADPHSNSVVKLTGELENKIARGDFIIAKG